LTESSQIGLIDQLNEGLFVGFLLQPAANRLEHIGNIVTILSKPFQKTPNPGVVPNVCKLQEEIVGDIMTWLNGMDTVSLLYLMHGELADSRHRAGKRKLEKVPQVLRKRTLKSQYLR
jgi:hypothetical protein